MSRGLMRTFRRAGGFVLVKQYLRSGVLPYAVGQLLLTGKSLKSLELLRLGTQLKVNLKLRRTYRCSLENFERGRADAVPPDRGETSRKVWICWMQGIENAPELVQKCCSSVRKHVTDREVVLITAGNRKEYAVFPDYIEQKYEAGKITHTHFSDLLRVELLAKHGGTWIDATVFCTGGAIPRYMLDSELFVFQSLKPGVDGHVLNISSWFMTARAGNRILLAVRTLLYEYWRKNDKLVDYFLLHHLFALAADFYAEDWRKIIPFSNSMPHVLLLRLFEPYDKECYEELKRICPFHKLTYKRTPEEFVLKGTYYDAIFGDNGERRYGRGG